MGFAGWREAGVCVAGQFWRGSWKLGGAFPEWVSWEGPL